jgi:hypothetical protein
MSFVICEVHRYAAVTVAMTRDLYPLTKYSSFRIKKEAHVRVLSLSLLILLLCLASFAGQSSVPGASSAMMHAQCSPTMHPQSAWISKRNPSLEKCESPRARLQAGFIGNFDKIASHIRLSFLRSSWAGVSRT